MELEVRMQELLYTLLSSDEYIGIPEIASKQGVSKRSVYYDLDKINVFLAMHKTEKIQIERSKGILLTNRKKQEIQELLKNTATSKSVYLSPEERMKQIVCRIVSSHHSLFIEAFMEDCQVSRNTIISDLKGVGSMLKEYGLHLQYENKLGYQIHGDVIRKRALFFLYFPALIPFYRNKTLSIIKPTIVSSYLKRLDYIEKTLDTKYIEDTLYTLATFIPTLKDSKDVLVFDDIDKHKIMDTYEYILVHKQFSDMSQNEQFYIALHLLGSRLQALPFDVMQEDERQEPYELAKQLLNEFMNISCITFDNREEIERSLFVHLKASLYRYRYGIQLGNPLIDDIKTQYSELFEITKRAVAYLSQSIGVPISDNEIAYLTLHFGAYITVHQNEKMRILIVCPSGISTGNMLKGEVSILIPYADAIDVISLSDLASKRAMYDVLITTIRVEDENSILVHPILSDEDRIQILKKCMKGHLKSQIRVEDLYGIMKKYVKDSDLERMKEDLKRYVDGLSKVQYHSLKGADGGLLAWLEKKHIGFYQEEMDWMEAIGVSSEALVETGSIETRYIDAMIAQIRLLGPYMFICKDVVLAHAKSEAGVNFLGVSVGVFAKEILFPKGRKAKMMIVLAAEDQVKHLKILKDIMRIFSKPNYNALFACRNRDELIAEMENLLCE